MAAFSMQLRVPVHVSGSNVAARRRSTQITRNVAGQNVAAAGFQARLILTACVRGCARRADPARLYVSSARGQNDAAVDVLGHNVAGLGGNREVITPRHVHFVTDARRTHAAHGGARRAPLENHAAFIRARSERKLLSQRYRDSSARLTLHAHTVANFPARIGENAHAARVDAQGKLQPIPRRNGTGTQRGSLRRSRRRLLGSSQLLRPYSPRSAERKEHSRTHRQQFQRAALPAQLSADVPDSHGRGSAFGIASSSSAVKRTRTRALRHRT